MSSSFEAVLGSRVVRSGRAIRRAKNRHHHLSKDLVMISTLRFGGERFRPSSFHFSSLSDSEGDSLIAPDFQDQRQVLEVLAEFGSRLRGALGQGRQIVVPNSATIKALGEMGRGMVYLQKRDWMSDRQHIDIRIGGRVLLEASRFSRTPGQSLLLPLASMVSMHWMTLSAPFERNDLVSLEAQIDPQDHDSGFDAATEVSSSLSAVGPNMNPSFEERYMYDLYRELSSDLESGEDSTSALRIRNRLTKELRGTHDLMRRMILREMTFPETESALARFLEDSESMTRRVERVSDPDRGYRLTEGPVGAARTLERLERRQERFAVFSSLEDPLIMVERALDGTGLVGEVVRSGTERHKGSRYGYMTVKVRHQTSLDVGASMMTGVGKDHRQWVIDDITHEDDHTLVYLETEGNHRKLYVPDSKGVTYLLAASLSGYRSLYPENTPWTHVQDDNVDFGPMDQGAGMDRLIPDPLESLSPETEEESSY